MESTTAEIASNGNTPRPRLGRYELGDALRTEAGGTVYRAHDTALDRTVAIKLVRGTTPQDFARLKKAAQAMARLDHPNTVHIYDAGSDAGQLFVVTELVDGVTVEAWLQRDAPSWRRIVDVYCAAGRGLAAFHNAGQVHGDFDATNILVTDEGTAKVTGLRVISTGRTATASNRADPITAATDQLAFCVALSQSLGSTAPVVQASAAERRGRATTPDQHVPARIRKALQRGRSSHPERRFASMDNLVDALTARDRPKRWLWSAVAALVVGAIAAIGMPLWSQQASPTCPGRDRITTVWNENAHNRLAARLAASPIQETSMPQYVA